MNETERSKQIDHLVKQIQEIKPEWIFLGVKLQTNMLNAGENEKDIHKKWNDLDFTLADLNKRLRSLQSEYHVDFFDDRGILVTAQVILNRRVEIDTNSNGWNNYVNKAEVNKLLIDIWEQLKRLANNPEIRHVRLFR